MLRSSCCLKGSAAVIVHSHRICVCWLNCCMLVLQGLPATVTSLLSLTALRLRDRQVLIKRTDIIENLGVATIIASDKTGTLTQNRMTVENLWCNMVGSLSYGGLLLDPLPASTTDCTSPQLLARLLPPCRCCSCLMLVLFWWLSVLLALLTAMMQELHGGTAFQPPPSAPLPSLERASTLAKQSLARRSNVGPNLGKMSRGQQNIGKWQFHLSGNE